MRASQCNHLEASALKWPGVTDNLSETMQGNSVTTVNGNPATGNPEWAGISLSIHSPTCRAVHSRRAAIVTLTEL